MKFRWMLAGLYAAIWGCSAGNGNAFPDAAHTTDVHTMGDTTLCAAGQVVCQGSTAKTCDGLGGYSGSIDCSGSLVCVAQIGCAVCAPGSHVCQPDGTPGTCAADGMTITADTPCTGSGHCSAGRCVDLCAEAAANHSYIGCDYWPVSLLNSELGSASTNAADPTGPPVGVDGFPYAVVVANPQSVTANVMITGGALSASMAQTVAPGMLQIIRLPWQQDVSQVTQAGATRAGGTSALVPNGAYHLVSDVPVTVYQFNALSYRDVRRTNCTPGVDGTCFSFTNDSSLLLPSTVLTGNYVAVSRATWGETDGFGSYASAGGFVTIVGTTANTHVTIQTTGSVRAGAGVAATPAHRTVTQTLGAGDVFQLVSGAVDASTCHPVSTPDGNGAFYCQPNTALDLTGSIITSDQPIAVYGGHDCSFVPFDHYACDHLEQQLFPSETLGAHYFVSRTQPQLPQREPNIIRIVSNRDGNVITFNPPTVQPTMTLNRGQLSEFEQDADVEITGSGPFAVVQYLVGENYFSATFDPTAVGDPSMSNEVPVEQWRNNYEFLAPDTYPVSFVNVVAPAGAMIQLDGTLLSGAMTSGTFDVYRVNISTHTGAHQIQSTDGMAFSIKVYGFGSFTSYMYPGGLDLTQISPPG